MSNLEELLAAAKQAKLTAAIEIYKVISRDATISTIPEFATVFKQAGELVKTQKKVNTQKSVLNQILQKLQALEAQTQKFQTQANNLKCEMMTLAPILGHLIYEAYCNGEVPASPVLKERIELEQRIQQLRANSAEQERSSFKMFTKSTVGRLANNTRALVEEGKIPQVEELLGRRILESRCEKEFSCTTTDSVLQNVLTYREQCKDLIERSLKSVAEANVILEEAGEVYNFTLPPATSADLEAYREILLNEDKNFQAQKEKIALEVAIMSISLQTPSPDLKPLLHRYRKADNAVSKLVADVELEQSVLFSAEAIYRGGHPEQIEAAVGTIRFDELGFLFSGENTGPVSLRFLYQDIIDVSDPRAGELPPEVLAQKSRTSTQTQIGLGVVKVAGSILAGPVGLLLASGVAAKAAGKAGGLIPKNRLLLHFTHDGTPLRVHFDIIGGSCEECSQNAEQFWNRTAMVRSRFRKRYGNGTPLTQSNAPKPAVCEELERPVIKCPKCQSRFTPASAGVVACPGCQARLRVSEDLLSSQKK